MRGITCAKRVHHRVTCAGMVPLSMASMYPALHRTTAFNFAHNCSMSLLGGLAPTVVTVSAWAPGVLLVRVHYCCSPVPLGWAVPGALTHSCVLSAAAHQGLPL